MHSWSCSERGSVTEMIRSKGKLGLLKQTAALAPISNLKSLLCPFILHTVIQTIPQIHSNSTSSLLHHIMGCTHLLHVSSYYELPWAPDWEFFQDTRNIPLSCQKLTSYVAKGTCSVSVSNENIIRKDLYFTSLTLDQLVFEVIRLLQQR